MFANKKCAELTRIDGKEESALHLSQPGVQILPPNARLHHNVHVLLVEFNNVVHVGKVNADSSVRGREVPLEAGTTRIWDNGHAVLMADTRNDGHLLRRSRVRHGHGQPIQIDRRPLGVAMHAQVFGIC